MSHFHIFVVFLSMTHSIYQCFAHNGHSMASSRAVAVPAPPSGVSCAPVDASHVFLQWDAINNTIAYAVRSWQPDGHPYPSQPTIKPEQTITLRDTLTPYRFQVQAYILSSGKAVATDYSESVTCQGQGVPINFTPTGDRVLVSWKQFFRESPGVLEWILQYRNEISYQINNVTLGPEIYNYTITSVPSTSLQVRVLGSRQLPWLHQNLTLVPWLSVLNISEGELKAKVEDVRVSEVGAREFTVQWKCDEAENSPENYVYMVCFEKLDEEEQCIETYDTWVKLAGLSPVSEYSVRVKARVPALPHLVTHFTQPIQVSTGSEEVQELEYSFINNGVTVSWKGAGARVVRYSQKMTQSLDKWSKIIVTGNAVDITGLDGSLQTYVMVTAPGQQSATQILTIPFRLPDTELTDPKHRYWTDGEWRWFLRCWGTIIEWTRSYY